MIFLVGGPFESLYFHNDLYITFITDGDGKISLCCNYVRGVACFSAPSNNELRVQLNELGVFTDDGISYALAVYDCARMHFALLRKSRMKKDGR